MAQGHDGAVNDAKLEQALDDAARLIVSSRHVVALVGAGLSVESGIPPFRGPGGMWTKYGEPDMRRYERFLDDPAKWWEERISRASTYKELVDALDEAVPNDGHFALRDMEEVGYLKHIITQNIDNLHQIAGSVAITEIHGNRTKVRCIMCNGRWDLDGFAMEELPPRCPAPLCRGLVKGDTVMFGEPIPRDALDECINQTRMCDCMLLVGTSAVVYPAAGFPEDVKRSGGTLIEVNPNETPLTDMCDVVLRAPAGESLPLVFQRVREMATA
jgi:NAD-dependent deacetylase